MNNDISTILNGIHNIIFDFGGVLFEIDYSAPAREFAKLGIADFSEIHSKAGQDKIFDLHETGKISNEEFFSYFLKHCPSATYLQLKDAWNSILTRPMNDQIKVVENLGKQGYRIFLLSNTNAVHVESFERMIDEEIGLPNFRSVFENIYYSNEIGFRKPSPEIFLKVCEWNGLVPGETLFIDDSIQHVKGAEQAGLRAIHLEGEMTVQRLFGGIFQ